MGFLGNELRQSYVVNGNVAAAGQFAPLTYVVNSGIESANSAFSVDVSDNVIHIDFAIDNGFFGFTSSGPRFEDVNGTIPDIIGVSLTTNMSGLDASDISWDANHIDINWAGLNISSTYYADLTVTFATPVYVDVLQFTPRADGTLAHPIDFNWLADNAYPDTGTAYKSLGGDDVVILPNLATVDAGNPWNFGKPFDGGSGDDVVQGGNAGDHVLGSGGNDWLWGRAGNDDLSGGAGNDVIAGGGGTDILNGSSGRDLFVFLDSELGTTRAGPHDLIGDFHPGVDKIDLSDLFSDVSSFGGVHRGALDGGASSVFAVGYTIENGRTWLQGDVTGDGLADFTVEMANRQSISSSDIIVNQSQWESFMGSSPLIDFATAHHDAIVAT